MREAPPRMREAPPAASERSVALAVALAGTRPAAGAWMVWRVVIVCAKVIAVWCAHTELSSKMRGTRVGVGASDPSFAL